MATEFGMLALPLYFWSQSVALQPYVKYNIFKYQLNDYGGY